MSPNRSPRLREFDYIGFCRYFLTICVYPRRPVFADIAAASEVRDQILRAADAFNFEITAYCLMPDHVHLLAAGTREDADLRRFMADWKRDTAFWWRQRTRDGLWQKGYFDRVLRDEDPQIAVVSYVVSNPVRAGLVERPQDYPLSGSSRYTWEQLADAIMDWSPHSNRHS